MSVDNLLSRDLFVRAMTEAIVNNDFLVLTWNYLALFF